MSEIESFESRIGRLDWSSEGRAESLDLLFRYALDKVEASARWYDRRRVRMRVFGRILRLLGLLLVSSAGVVPVLAQIMATAGGSEGLFLQPGWASVLLAAAGAVVMIDRFFGHSSSWMRFVTEQLELERLRTELLLDWEIERASWQGEIPNADQVGAQLTRLREIVVCVDHMAIQETAAWRKEFESVLTTIDRSVAAPRTLRPSR